MQNELPGGKERKEQHIGEQIEVPKYLKFKEVWDSWYTTYKD